MEEDEEDRADQDKRATYKLIHEWIVDHPDDGDTFDCQTDGGADHGVSVDLSVSKIDHKRGKGGHTKLVVPSIGLKISWVPRVRSPSAHSTIELALFNRS